jgi:hypothetical protein
MSPPRRVRVRATADPWRATPEDQRRRRHVNLTLPPEVVAELDRMADAEGVSRSVVVERLVLGRKR